MEEQTSSRAPQRDHIVKVDWQSVSEDAVLRLIRSCRSFTPRAFRRTAPQRRIDHEHRWFGHHSVMAVTGYLLVPWWRPFPFTQKSRTERANVNE